MARFREARVADVVGFRGIENEVNRVILDDRRQYGRGLTTGNEIADIDALIGNPSVDRGTDLGPFQIQRGRFNGGLRSGLLGAGDRQIRLPLIEIAPRDILVANQPFSAGHFCFVQLHLRAGAGHIGAGGFERNLVSALIDGEEKVTLFHHLPVAEMHLLDIARHARAQVDALHRFKAASILVPLGHLLSKRRCDRYGRGGRCPLAMGR